MSDQQLLCPSNSFLTVLLADVINSLTQRRSADVGCKDIAIFVGS